LLLFEFFLVLILKFHLQAGRVKTVIDDGVKEIWLSSEDTGAYGNILMFLLLCMLMI
jgi:hypothetical protein